MILTIVMLLVVLAMIVFKADRIFYSLDEFFAFAVMVAELLGSVLAITILLTIYCTIPGAIIMALIETIRFRK